MRDKGLLPNAVNSYLRGVNPYLAWLHENDHLQVKLKLKRLKCPDKNLKTLSDQQIRSLLSYKPTNFSEARLLAILTLLTDSGLRIREAMSLRRKDADLDNLLIDVVGKGGKFRRVPISPECRKVLFKHLRSHNFDLVFCTRSGCPVIYDNMRRDFRLLCGKLAITGFDSAFHAFRRYFATYAIRRNVNPLLVQRMMGHSSLQMLNRYCKTEVSDLSVNHVSALQTGGAGR
jgi:integrase/recombinase XerD